jgi:hypothetical protein
MKKYIKIYLHRGLIFGGFGSIIVSMIYFYVSESLGTTFSGKEIFIAILSGYFIAFVHAGASVFNSIEEWPPAKSLFFHLGTLYITYSFFYLINSWLPFDPIVFLIFTANFILIYIVVWAVIYLSIKAAAKKFGKQIKK